MFLWEYLKIELPVLKLFLLLGYYKRLEKIHKKNLFLPEYKIKLAELE
jgi:hypothetical protein